MRTLQRWIAMTTGLVVLAGCTATRPPPPDHWDELQLRPDEHGSALYVRPGLTPTHYRSATVGLPVIVTSGDWSPTVGTIPVGQGYTTRRMSEAEIDATKNVVAAEVRRIFSQELEDDGYTVVMEPGSDTVQFVLALVDVCLDGPYCGQMTLVAELRDGTTGQPLARIVDQKKATMGTLVSPYSVTEHPLFRQAVHDWTRQVGAVLNDIGTTGLAP